MFRTSVVAAVVVLELSAVAVVTAATEEVVMIVPPLLPPTSDGTTAPFVITWSVHIISMYSAISRVKIKLFIVCDKAFK